MIYHFPDGSETKDRAAARDGWVANAARMVRQVRLGRFKLDDETWDMAVAAGERAGKGAGRLFDEIYS